MDGGDDRIVDTRMKNGFEPATGLGIAEHAVAHAPPVQRAGGIRRAAAERAMAMQGTAMAMQNMLLLAHAEGLAACWMCAPLFCPDAVRAALDLPADWEPQALLTLGHPAAPGRQRERRPIAEIVQP